MTQEEILEGNKLIAEFLGWREKESVGEVLYMLDEHICMSYSQLEDFTFHEDFNELLLVLDKIEDNWEEISITGSREMTGGDHKEYECEIVTTGYQYITQARGFSSSRIEAVYQACLQYIRKYNTGTLTQPTK